MSVVSVTAAGITGGNPRPMTATERTITEHSYGIAPTTKDVHPGTAADAWSAYVAFNWPTLYIILEAFDNNLDIGLSVDGGVTYKDEKQVTVANPMIIPFTATGFRVRNATPGLVADYEIAGLGTGF